MELKKMIKNTLILTLISISCLFSDTSTFSTLSLGDIEPTINNSTGIAFSDSLILKNHNYASWAYLSNTSFSLSASYYAHSTENAEGIRSDYDRFTFEDISFALPFGERHFFGFSYYPVSVTDITSVTESEVAVPESFENTSVMTLENKKGSISNISLIYGKGFNNGLSAAFNASFKLGNYDAVRKYKYTTYVWDPEDSVCVADWEKYFESSEKTQLFHFTAGGGFLYNSPLGLKIGGQFSVPLYSYVNKITGFERTTSYGTQVEEFSLNEYEVESPEWPAEFGIGFSYIYSKFVFSYDYSGKQFSGLDLGIDKIDLSNYSRNIFGVSYDPRHRKYDPYYKRMVYSAYFTAEKRPYEYGDEAIYDYTGTLGLNFPFNRDKTNIEVKFSLTQSGSAEDNGLEDNIFKLQFNLISSDSWRLKKEKYDD